MSEKSIEEYTRLLRTFRSLTKNGLTVSSLDRELRRKAILAKFPNHTDADSRFCHYNCGNGYHFLTEALLMKLENGVSFEKALSTIYGVSESREEIEECRNTLLCGHEEYRHIVERNVVCHKVETYDNSFNGTDLTDEELEAKNRYNLSW